MADIMIVEDESIVALDLSNCLKNLGYSISSIQASGEESVDKAGTEQPDAVLMDIHLRDEMDGIEAAEQIYKRFQIPVVFVSAFSDSELLNRAKKVGSFGYIVKPFEEREVFAALEMALYKSKAEKERDKLIAELKAALEQVKELRGIIPICSHCKKIRDDKGYWHQVEEYVSAHSDVQFSHALCIDCVKEHYPDLCEDVLNDMKEDAAKESEK